jgi:hypothetical protein
MQHGRRLGRGVDEQIVAAARRNTFDGFVDWLMSKGATWAKRRVIAAPSPSRIVTQPVAEPQFVANWQHPQKRGPSPRTNCKGEQVHPQHVSRKRRRVQLRKQAVLSDKMTRQEAPGWIADHVAEVQHPPG